MKVWTLTHELRKQFLKHLPYLNRACIFFHIPLRLFKKSRKINKYKPSQQTVDAHACSIFLKSLHVTACL